MPIFARRRLQMMLDELGAAIPQRKANDLLARLEHRRTASALAAEFELALLWAIKQVAHMQVEPQIPGAKPDALSNDLFASGPVLIEITAVSDDTFSGRADMDRAANIIVQFANRIRKNAGKNLYFEFFEAKSRERTRHRRVTKDFALTSELEATLRAWLSSPSWPNPEAIRLTDRQIDVMVRWRDFVLPLFRTFSSMPAVAYAVEENPVFKALKRKERQLSGAPRSILRCIFLADAGCEMLRNLRPMGAMEVSGDQVIRHFLARSSVDVVCVFSPHRNHYTFSHALSSLNWAIQPYDRRNVNVDAEYKRVAELAVALPRPHLEGYQARQWHRQGMFDPQKHGQYLGTKMISKMGDELTIKISARAVQDLLAGRITFEKFRHFALGDHRPNVFDHQLNLGRTFHSARIEKAGIDEDDDYLVFELRQDPAVLPLRNPKFSEGFAEQQGDVSAPAGTHSEATSGTPPTPDPEP